MAASAKKADPVNDIRKYLLSVITEFYSKLQVISQILISTPNGDLKANQLAVFQSRPVRYNLIKNIISKFLRHVLIDLRP